MEVLDSPMDTFVLASITKSGKVEEIVKAKTGEHHTVELKINGIEVPFKWTVEELKRRIFEDVNQLAYEMACDYLQNKGNLLCEVINELQQHTKETVCKHFNARISRNILEDFDTFENKINFNKKGK